MIFNTINSFALGWNIWKCYTYVWSHVLNCNA